MIELSKLRYEDPLIKDLIKSQQKDGSWNYKINDPNNPNQYDWVPLRTAFPLRALASMGYNTDQRSLKAYQWLLSHQLEDGGFPTGQRKKQLVLPAGYRRIPHSKFACRTYTILSLECFASHPEYRSMPIMKRGLDLVLSRETFDRYPLGLEVARRIGVHPKSGFFTYYAKHDLAVILSLAWKLGANKSNERIKNIINFLLEQKTSYGIWEYMEHHHVSRWITYDLLFSLKKIDQETDWVSLEPQTPFRMYNHPPKRF